MKSIMFTMLAVLAMAGAASAQEKVKDGTVASPETASEASAVLELESTGKGFLPPRLSTAQRNAVRSTVTEYFKGIRIYSDGISSQINEVRVLDTNGDVLMSTLIPEKQNDIHKLSKGTYVVEIKESNGIVSSHKLVIGK